MAKTTSKKKPDDGSGDGPNFEQSLARLEQIVETLDDGNLPLEKSLALFKEGTKLARACRELLAEAEVQVKEALRDVESPRSTADLDGEEDADDEEDGG
ncbi:MAG TPA: exodeoxyribonuclease VII small subunit [Candidatus Eremiobacteraceae bacterium]|nr:exodeoxyribonuclease VII small subunit [Candidatus Eremiobacteraceae bacterium]